MLVIRGMLRYFVGDQGYLLGSGDSIWHRSDEPHGWRGLGRTATVSLHVKTPPVW